jgi:hypothetical protein
MTAEERLKMIDEAARDNTMSDAAFRHVALMFTREMRQLTDEDKRRALESCRELGAIGKK